MKNLGKIAIFQFIYTDKITVYITRIRDIVVYITRLWYIYGIYNQAMVMHEILLVYITRKQSSFF
jgi:hypothetical protein